MLIKNIDISNGIYYNVSEKRRKEYFIMENNIIMLEDENGCMIEFEAIDVFEFEGVTYFALMEVLPDDEPNDEVLIMQVEGDIENEEAELVMVDDEAQLERAFNEFLRRDEEMNGEE